MDLIIIMLALRRSLNALSKQRAPITALFAKPQVFATLPQRQFSNFAQIEKAQQKLSKALESEIKYESENYSQLEDIENFLNEAGFHFSETADGLTITLKKTIDGREVTVSFDAR